MSEIPTLPTTVVRPGDKRYPALSRGFNQRWIGEPEYVRLVRTPEEARAALAEAVNEAPERTRITVKAGGHCYEDFVCGEDVRVILALSHSVLKLQYQVYWTRHDTDEVTHIAWIRDAYKATFAETGGVPVAGGKVTDGCYIGYPDADLNDGRWNESEQSWKTLYCKDAYAKLQEIKRYWDPLNVFRHAQSSRPGGDS